MASDDDKEAEMKRVEEFHEDYGVLRRENLNYRGTHPELDKEIDAWAGQKASPANYLAGQKLRQKILAFDPDKMKPAMKSGDKPKPKTRWF